MLIDELKKRMFAAMKSKDTVEKEILRTVIGDVTATGETPDDARVLLILKKLVKSNEETVKVAQGETKATLERELSILRGFLPRTLGVEQISERLGALSDQIRAAGNEGQAMGIAMKHLKALGEPVESGDVKLAVKQLREGS